MTLQLCCIIHTMETVKRFESGVHDQSECGLNKSGYAAIDSTIGHVDVHKLSSCIIQSTSRPLLHHKKRSFLSSDGLIYIFMKLMKNMPSICTYILLLSREMPVSMTLRSIIEASALASNIIVVVIELGGVFSIDIYFMDIHISHRVESCQSLKRFLVQSGLADKVIIIGYPSLPDSYIEIVNSMNTMMWCAPASRHLTYSSLADTKDIEHFVYPWSKSPLCSGFTVGKGKIKYSSNSERNKYIGLYNTYETMISSVPCGISCTDCIELQSIAMNIKNLVGFKDKSKGKRHFKRSSIDALEELKTMIREATSQC